MMQSLRAGLWFLRLGPLWIGLVAVAILVSGYYLQVLDNQREADMARALASGPPAAVAISDFNPDIHSNDADEAVVTAQILTDHMYDLTIDETSTRSIHVVMIPVVDPTSTNAQDVLGVIYFDIDEPGAEFLNDDLEIAWYRGEGKFGPIYDFNGELDDMGKWEDMTRDAFVDQGLNMPQTPVILQGFGEGRDVALAPREASALTIFGVFSKVAGVLGLLALGKVAFRGTSQQASEPAAVTDTDFPVDGINVAPAQAEAQARRVPLWKRRSGIADLADPDGFEPDYSEPDVAAEPAQASHFMDEMAEIETAPRRGFGLRKILIGVVGAVFALLLGAVAYDALGTQTGPDAAPTTASVELAPAQPAPEHKPYEINLEPVQQWLTAKYTAALAGDTSAQITLGLIVGAVFLLTVGLKFFFMMRRSLQPKTTARFDSMGIN